MKNIRKAVALLLVLVMCVSLCCMSASAANDTDELLAAVKTEAAQIILDGLLAREENIEFGYAIKYKVDMATAQTILSSAIEAGKAFAVASALVTAELETVYNAALTHNGVPTQGDYLAHNNAKHSFTFVNYDFSQIATKGILIVKVKLSVDYRTTLAQEEAVTTALADVVTGLGLVEELAEHFNAGNYSVLRLVV